MSYVPTLWIWTIHITITTVTVSVWPFTFAVTIVMANQTIVPTFNGKYWEYGGSDVDKKGLTIGGFESAFLADLVAAFILENSQDLFENSIYSKIYRDDGIKVDLGIQTTDEICDWLEIFQTRVNEVTGSDSLKFTMEIWNPDSPPDEKPRNERVTIVRKEAFHIWIWKCIGEKMNSNSEYI